MPIDEATIMHRVTLGQTQMWTQRRDFIQGLRRLAHGDWSDLGIMPRQDVPDDGTDGSQPANEDTRRQRLVQLRDAIEGRQNHMARALANIAMGLTNNAPVLEFEGLDPEYALFHRLYFERTLGPRPFGCNFAPQCRKVAFDACFAEAHFALSMYQGVPGVIRVAPERVIWDMSGDGPHDAEWVVFEEPQRASYWAKVFKDKKDIFDRLGGDADQAVLVTFYYDVSDQEKPVYRAFAVSDGGEPELVDDGEYPFVYTAQIAGQIVKHPYLPWTPVAFAHMPGSPWCESIAYRMVPHQRAILEANAQQLKQMRMGPKRIIDLAGLDDDTVTALKNGDPDNLFRSQEGLNGHIPVFENIPGVPLDQALIVVKEDNERMITAASGEDPFVSGANNDRTYERATQVQAVQSASRLTTDYRSEIFADAMADILQKYLWAAHEYDDRPMTLNYENAVFEFGGQTRVGARLDPNTRVIVRKDTMRYMPQSERVLRAKDLLATAMQSQNPAFIQKATTEYLKAQGVPDAGAWLAMTEMDAPGQIADPTGQTPVQTA